MALTQAQIGQAKRTVDAWLVAHLDHADPYTGHGAAELLFRRKCFNEIAFYLLWSDRLGRADAAAAMRGFVEARLDDDFLSLAGRSSERLLIFLGALSYAGARGLFDAPRQRFVRELLAGPFAWSIDGSAFRHMELLTACHCNGVAAPLTAAQVFATSALAVPPSPIHASRDACYTLTHAAFYRFLLDEPVGTGGADVTLALEGAQCRALAVENVDLGLELLAATLLLGRPPGAAAVMLLENVVDELLAHGVIRENGGSAVAQAFARSVPQQAGWAGQVHSMLVAGMALMVAEARWDNAAADTPARRFASGIGTALEAFGNYQLLSGLRRLDTLEVPARATDAALLACAVDFIALNRRPDGRFGHFVDELALYRRTHADGPGADVLTGDVDAACRRYLAGPTASGSSPGTNHLRSTL